MRLLLTRILITVLLFSASHAVTAQLVITENSNAAQLVQKLVGQGIVISNPSITGSPIATGFFNNISGTNIGLDSGVVLSNGRVKTTGGTWGMDGDGSTPAQTSASSNSGAFASTNLGLGGYGPLSTLLGATTQDATMLKFDFVPLGDTINFRYVFSSEEYPEFPCSGVNDGFAFFIQGPGFPVATNIALIPGTTAPVSIDNINDIPGCGVYPQYYLPNKNNRFFTHNGHTTIFTAAARVQPCQTYTLTLVVADVSDHIYDSGVFLEAGSLSSNAIGMTNQTQTDPRTGLSYLVEGCVTGAFDVRRPRKDPFPLVVNLSYGGTAINGVDYQPMTTSVIIPANDSFVRVNVIPLVDNLPEGVEKLVVYALAGCATGTPTDSTVIEIRDYDILAITPKDTSMICRNSTVQLVASTGYTTYQWMPDPTLNDPTIRDPFATPVTSGHRYICTATLGDCNARDSVFLIWKEMEFISKIDVNCSSSNNGQIKVEGGPEWTAPVSFSLDGITWQSDSTFNNLTAGTYWVKIRDASCIDSIQVTIAQAFPDVLITGITTTPASCSGNPDGTITVTGGGGNGTFEYSLDGTNFQPGNSFNVNAGSYTITIRDGNGCSVSQTNIIIPLDNTVTVDAGPDATICEGTSFTIPAVSNGTSFAWTPSATLDNSTLLTPKASPATNTKYYIKATSGVCDKIDSMQVFIRPAPLPDAGADASYCYGKQYQLHGSGGVSFEWSPATYFISPTNTQDPDVKALKNIKYQLMVTDGFGCRSLVPDEVSITVVPAVRIFAGNDTVAAMNQPIQLKVKELSSAGVTNYTWSPSFGLSTATGDSPVATLTADQRFIVTGTTPDGCQGMDDILVKVYKGPDIYVPSGFTPNNDGLNDVLKPVPVGIKEFRFFRVFNRWGQMIFATNDPGRGWDGRINGIKQSTGTYVWMAEAVDYKGNLITKKGVVTIIR